MANRPGKRGPRRWNLADAKAKLSELVERAARGEDVVISLRGKPRVRLVPYNQRSQGLRVPGKGKGRFQIGADFNDPLPPDVLATFLDQP